MKAALDVHYPTDRADVAIAACVVFREWTDAVAETDHVAEVSGVLPYVPGRFFERELPCLLAVLRTLAAAPDVLVIDGNVTLDVAGKKGLGAYLHDALGGRPVIGVAKTLFRGAPVMAVLRGKSARPLFVTAMGMATSAAAGHIRSMHGAHRVPTLLQRVDRLSRGGAT